MIKNYKIFKESLLNKLEGPAKEEVVEYILKLDSFRMLEYSIDNNYIEGIIAALNKNPKLKNNYYFIRYAVECNCESEILSYLFKRGFKFRDSDYHLLRHSLRMRNYETCKLLIDNLNKITEPITMLYLVKYGNYDIIKYIVDVDTNPQFINLLLENIENSVNSFGVYHEQRTIDYLKTKINLTESLLNKLEGPSEEEIFNSVKDLNPDEMLLKACKSDLINLAKYAIEKGANIVDETLIFTALLNNNVNILRFLLNGYKKLNIKFERFNLLLNLASQNGYLDIVKYLVEEQNANISHNNNYNIKWSSSNGHLGVVKYLVEHGADIHADNNYALKAAKEYKHYDVVNYLEEQIEKEGIKESLLNKLEGPNEEEILNDLNKLSYNNRIIKIIKKGKDLYKFLPKEIIIDIDYLDVSDCGLVDLPDNLTINGDFNCSYNELTYLPNNLIIKGELWCHDNQLLSLPDDLKVGSNIDCSNNQLSSLPENLIVDGYLNCRSNHLYYLPDKLVVNGDLDCSDNLDYLDIPKTSKINGQIFNTNE